LREVPELLTPQIKVFSANKTSVSRKLLHKYLKVPVKEHISENIIVTSFPH